MYSILKSRVRRKILEIFIYHPGAKYYVRQLERLIGASAGNIRRELLRLRDEGIFKTEKTGNLVFYFLNMEYPLLGELKSIVLKKSDIRIKLSKVLESDMGVKHAFIYGSHAAGEDSSGSDIDIFVIGTPDLRNLTKVMRSLEKSADREINLTCMTMDEVNDLIIKKDGFITDICSSPRIDLVGDSSDIG